MKYENTVLMLVGIPASGKSTLREELLKKYTSIGYVNKDEIRAAFTTKTSNFSKEQEKKVKEIETSQLQKLFDEKTKLIVIDNTNLTLGRYNSYKQLALNHGYDFKPHFMMDSFDVEGCHKRNMTRTHDKHVPVPVIENMALNFFGLYDYCHKTTVENEANPSCILVDIDGTIAIHGSRSPFEWHRVGEDVVDEKVYELITYYKSTGKKIVFMSGRDSCCRTETLDWFKKYEIPYDELYMRVEGDSRKDSIVKWELYDKYVRGNYNVHVVLDDRNQVCRVWRGIGLKVFQVESGWF